MKSWVGWSSRSFRFLYNNATPVELQLPENDYSGCCSVPMGVCLESILWLGGSACKDIRA